MSKSKKRNERYLNLKAVKRAVCTNFQNTGRCRFGDRCRYEHVRIDTKASEVKTSGANEEKESSQKTISEKQDTEEQENGKQKVEQEIKDAGGDGSV